MINFRYFYPVYLPRGDSDHSEIPYEYFPMTSYTVQLTMPVDNPVDNVCMTRKKHHMTFEVPLNHPDVHRMNLMDLIAAAELSGLLGLPTHLKNKSIDIEK
jgi:hypothetical protein